MLAMKSKAAGALVACLASLAATASSSSSSSSTVEGQQAYDFTNSQNYSSEAWSYIGGGSIEPSEEGLVLSLDKQGDYPTLVSVDTLLYGTFETVLKTASGQGIVTAAVFMSDEKDEIDWEWIGGQAYQVQTNFYSKGKVGTGANYGSEGTANTSNTQTSFHTYKATWNQSMIEWAVDGAVVRQAPRSSWPGQINTAMYIKLGLWAGGDSGNSNGTIEWAGGETDYSQAPFNMTIQSVTLSSSSLSDSGNSTSSSGNSSTSSSGSSSSSAQSGTLSGTATSASSASTSTAGSDADSAAALLQPPYMMAAVLLALVLV